MAEGVIFCRICLEKNRNTFSLYLYVQQKYLPSLIENLCGILISSLDEPKAHVCRECALALLGADEIILKCQGSNKILTQQKILKIGGAEFEKQLQLKNKGTLDWKSHNQCVNHRTADVEGYETNDATNDISIQLPPRKSKDLNFTSTLIEVKQEASELHDLDTMDESLYVEPQMLVESILEIPETINNKNSMEMVAKSLPSSPQPNIYSSTNKGTSYKKKYVRSREQYLKRKIRNLPVKEPLTLIGGAGVVRKRKPKSFHRAIPNFYFKCELCHEFESNVASYSVTHLNKIHQIDRPAIFKCQFCDAKPFIKNQSLQEHISTIHQQQPKPRDYECTQCGKSFIKNCHLQKHLISVHKHGFMSHQCEQKKFDNLLSDCFTLQVHMKQTQNLDQPHACDLCGNRFAVINGLRAHIKTMHPVSCLTCTHCGHKFTNKKLYETHMRRARCNRLLVATVNAPSKNVCS